MGSSDTARVTLLSASAPPAERKRSGLALIVPFITIVLGIGWWGSRQGWYTPGSDLGYNLGLAGGLMMLVLLLYPLRKHWHPLQSFGPLKYWFRLHMMLGITGPLLIILHSNFTFGSLNAGVALTCMILVAGSGIIGRFIYTKIHHGLYGRRASLQDRQALLGISAGDVKSKFHFAPKVEQRLKDFESNALAPSRIPFSSAWRFLTLRLQVQWHYSRAVHDLKHALKPVAKRRGWSKSKLIRRYAQGKNVIRAYLALVQDVAQFKTYERLFSLWHVVHIPFVFMLAFSAIFHVIAVHMY